MTLNAKMLVVAVEVTVDDIVLVAVTCASDHCLNEHDGKDPKQHDHNFVTVATTCFLQSTWHFITFRFLSL